MDSQEFSSQASELCKLITAKILRRYNDIVGKSLLNSNPDQTVKGLVKAVRYLMCSLGHGQVIRCDNNNIYWSILVSQSLKYETTSLYLVDGSFSSKITYRNSIYDLVKNIRDDPNLRKNLTVRELRIRLYGYWYEYNPAEDILLGREPCLRLIDPPKGE